MIVQKKLISTNHTKGGNKRQIICIHTMVGALDGTDSHFNNPSSQVSSHYGVDLDGSRVFQWVEEKDQAYAQGTIDRPTAKVVLDNPGVNPNTYCISIECADGRNPGGADRSLQLPVLVQLVRDISQRNGIPLDRYHVIGHKEIRASKTCPGNIDVDYIVNEAKKTPMQDNLENRLKKDFGVKTLDELKTVWDKEMEHLKNAREDIKVLKKDLADQKAVTKAQTDALVSSQQEFSTYVDKLVEKINPDPKSYTGVERSKIVELEIARMISSETELMKKVSDGEKLVEKIRDEKQAEIDQLKKEIDQLKTANEAQNRQIERLSERLEAIEEGSSQLPPEKPAFGLIDGLIQWIKGLFSK